MNDDVPVRIAVKSVYDRNLTMEFDTLFGYSTILQLKQLVQERLPSSALPKHQRLIFGGKICDDQQTLAQVLKRMEPNETYTFHLLVSERNKTLATSAPSPQATTTTPPTISAAPQATAPSNTTSTIPSTTSPSPPPQPSSFPQANSPSPPEASSTSTAPFPPAQAMHLQHYLAQQELMILMQIQYLEHIRQYQQAHGIRAFETPTPVAPVLFPVHFSAAIRLPGVAGAAAAANAPAAGVRRFQTLRAVLSLLDITLALKMTVMVYIIGQDLPPPRSYVLISLAVVIYLYMTGILLKIYDILNGNPHIDRAPRPDNNNGDGLFNQDNDMDAAAQAPRGPPLVTIATETGLLKDIQSFFVGLVLSLFPSWRPLATTTRGVPPNEMPAPPVANQE
ncbi:unnamed protein product [Aphanomyces euteiches]|uniref:Ubiquitin-like domain-containing protein n=1 Tax=Aphanomyces euteiches TaxID=100861 RepID=A0A6G0WK89_9STRA|nr:hypothetical protein Ae201684_014292 [Aphanomyces euteiches]KAH9069034.1 hypothetical protein Ae201684P_004731 [Aphanomyces euteiches]KAH9137898.1 hypothetical protein AeRB84_017606 [Aphanomyces euteiches]